ncbi:MAG TPA: D-alanyl-D-alanine carboxypeptidase/D-alanyl-D-alanine-endopeptidase [Actinoplanes sp.]|jgi:D-alanyl-D-alanine carboxypeptidase/D-alanyl-D-alanine-endopeptidase (penicillin-binding protein 4)
MRIRTLARPFGAVAALTLATVAAGGPIGAAAAGPATARVQLASPASDAALVATLDQLFTDSRLNGALATMHVRDGATGAVVYSRGADQRVIPASNEKLMTSAAALEVLGPGYRFHTKVLYTGSKTGKTVTGSLYVQGQGDPTMTAARYDALAAAVAAAGITKVNGRLVGDDTWFDKVPLGLDWSWQDETYADNAAISALTVASTADFDTGSVAVQSRPGSATGKPATLTLVPANTAVKVVNKTTTGAAGSADTVTATRAHGTNTVTVTGSSPLNATASGVDLVAVQNPTVLAVDVFRAALKKHGVTVVGANASWAAPATHKVVVDQTSIPLSQLLTPFLKLSNNGHAELLMKAMGRAKSPAVAGSWPTGLSAANAALAGLGVDTAVIRMGDGSGLSRRNWLTTRQIANLLYAAQSRPWFATWYAALPIAGNPARLVGGTLASRMTGTPAANNLHGKTGTLSSVNALSGYVNDTTGRRLVFSALSNNALVNVSGVLDSAGVALASSGSAGAGLTARRLAPVTPHIVTRDGADIECSWVKAC